jgi:hypothetical protein
MIMLRISLLSDAAFEIVAAIFCFAAAGSVVFSNLENQALIFNALGIVFLVAGVLAAYAAMRPNPALIWFIIALNVVGGVAAVGVALFGGLEPQGNVIVIGIVGATLLVVGALQVVALRKNSSRTLTI